MNILVTVFYIVVASKLLR